MANEERMLLYVQTVVVDLLAALENADPAKELKLLQQIDNILNQFGLNVAEVMPPMILADYFAGVDEATAALAAAGASVAPALAITSAGLISQPFQKPIHMKAVSRLIDDSMLDMAAAINMAQVYGKATVERALAEVRADLATGLIKGNARKVTQKKVMDSFLKEGMTAFVTSDNKRLPLDFYAMTVTRTKTRAATVAGNANRYTDAGQDLVQINGNGDSCEVCARFNGLVVSLNGATPGYPVIGQNGIRLPPFHPNCRCALRPIIVRFQSRDELAAIQKRNDAYSPTKDPRTPAQKRAYENEQRLRRIANAEKKQFMNWQAELGADAPKTLAAFRRMKRKNTPKFQELQSNFRSSRMTKN